MTTPPKLTMNAETVARLKDLGSGWEDSFAPVTISARDAEALGFAVDQHPITGDPLAFATVTGHDLFLATDALQVTE